MADATARVLGGQRILQRKARYEAMLDGKLFKATHQTPGSAVTGQTSYVATTPTFLIYQAAATTSIVGLSMWLCQAGTVAGGVIDIAIGMASTNLYSSGGTAVVPQQSDMSQTTASNATMRFNPTTTGVPSRVLWAITAPATLGTVTSIDFEDGFLIGVTGSIAVYTWAAATGPTWRFGFEWIEE